MAFGITARRGKKYTAIRQAVEALETRRLLAATIFSENFDGVSTQFTPDAPATNLWHVSDHASQSPAKAMYYGIDATENYNTTDGGGNATANAGTVTSSTINLSAYSAAHLRLRYFLQTENTPAFPPDPEFPLDVAKVQIKTTDVGATWQDLASNLTGSLADGYGWNLFTADLTSYATTDKTVQLRFSFDTIDEAANNYIGWFVDDVVITDAVPVEITSVSPAFGEEITTTNKDIVVTFGGAVTGVTKDSLVLGGSGGTVDGVSPPIGNVYTFHVSGLKTGTLSATIGGPGITGNGLTVQPVTTKYAVRLPDRFEANEAFGAARNLGTVATRTESGLSIDTPGDVDYFQFTPDANGSVTISTKADTYLGEVSLFVYDSAQNLIGYDDAVILGSDPPAVQSITASASPADDTQVVTIANAVAGQTYYIKVSGLTTDDVVHEYALTVAMARTNAMSVVFTATFTGPVTGVDASDFSIRTTGTATGAIASVVQDPKHPHRYEITVTTSGDGTVALDLVDDDSIKNAALVPLGGTGTGNGNYTGPAYTVDHTAPATQSFIVGDGTAQRSKVGYITIIFTEPVSLGATPFTLRKHDLTPLAATLSVTNPSGDQKTYVIAFSGTGTTGGSLNDGVYDVAVNGASVVDLASNTVAGSPFQAFHRLFGDSDGDRDVDNVDFVRFLTALNRPSGYKTYFDYTGNGAIDNTDYVQFLIRLNRVTYPVY